MKTPVLSFRSLVSTAKLKTKGTRQLKRKQIQEDEFEKFEYVTILAIDDILIFSEHVISLLGNTYAKKIGVIDWINDVQIVMTTVLQSIHDKKISVGSANYDDNEEMEMIEDVLDNMWSYDFDEDGKSELLTALIEFWLKEIKDRGYTIYGLLNGSEDICTVELAMKCLKCLNYPPVYGSN